MRIRKLLAIPLLSFVLTGCIKDDLSQCRLQDNVRLYFTYNDVDGSPFTDYIEKTDLFLFDDEGKFLFHDSVEGSELTVDNPGITLTLAPGIYYALAWGNVGGNSAYQNLVTGVTTMDECLVEINPASTHTGDPVYYAPRKPRLGVAGTRSETDMTLYEVVVPAQGRVEKTLEFVRAHRSIYVWIRGFKDTDERHPTVEAKGLWSRYDFRYRTHAHRRDFRQQAGSQTMQGTAYARAAFHHAYGDIDSGMNILVRRTSDDELSQTVSVSQFLEENPSSGTDDIHIMLTFVQDLGVTVSLPEWIAKPVQPGID